MNKQGVGRWGSLVEKSTWQSEEVRRNYSAVTRITGITVLPSYLSWKRNRRTANLGIFEGTCRKSSYLLYSKNIVKCSVHWMHILHIHTHI